MSFYLKTKCCPQSRARHVFLSPRENVMRESTSRGTTKNTRLNPTLKKQWNGSSEPKQWPASSSREGTRRDTKKSSYAFSENLSSSFSCLLLLSFAATAPKSALLIGHHVFVSPADWTPCFCIFYWLDTTFLCVKKYLSPCIDWHHLGKNTPDQPPTHCLRQPEYRAPPEHVPPVAITWISPPIKA